MRFQRINIELEPNVFGSPEQGFIKLRVWVYTEDNVMEYAKIFKQDDFESLFTRVMRHATEEIIAKVVIQKRHDASQDASDKKDRG